MSRLALQSLRDGDTAKFLIQLDALRDIDPPEPVLQIAEVEARAEAEYRAWKAERGQGNDRDIVGRPARVSVMGWPGHSPAARVSSARVGRAEGEASP
jgi:hypothetical protein